ncbi:MAG TPA: FAD-dependent oxidoreductase, partial [Patescibacteria group bacterium]|nr:FAD-dependent oxidoreductase [Patescibacteria group bacterium]
QCKKLSQIDLGPFSWQSGCLQFANQAIFHPAKYLFELAAILKARGAVICTGSPVLDVKGGEAPVVTVSDGYTVAASSVVIATHTPINDTLKIHTKQAAYRSYTIALKIPKDVYKPFLLWDMNDPYHYVRPLSGENYDLLIVGGEDHKTGQANDGALRYQAIEDWARGLFPRTGPVLHQWSGQIINAIDGIAFIGRSPGERNIYIATAFSGNGMSYGVIAAGLIRDLIKGQDNPFEKIYDPDRKMFGAIGDYVRENSNAFSHMIRDWVAPAEVDNEDQIGIDEGAILRRGMHKIAAYRDPTGVLHQRSASCTHYGCVLQWNGSERSWDCPCDGSRFTPDGIVLHGPATRPLSRVDELAPISGTEPATARRVSSSIDTAAAT